MERIVFPLGNGVGVFENNKLCVSVVDSAGNKKVGGKIIKAEHKFFNLPVIRGFTYFFRGIWLYIQSFLLSVALEDRPPNETNKSFKITKNINIASSYIVMVAVLVAGFLFGFLGLGVLPSYIFRKAFSVGTNYYFRSFMIALFRFSLLYIIFTLLRFMPFMSGLYSFNGAGNMLLSGKEDTLRPRTHPLNFLNFLVNVFLFSSFVISLIAVDVLWPVNFLINLAIFFAIVPIAYEYLYFAGKSKHIALKDVTMITNWLVTCKPNTTHKEVLKVAQIEISSYADFEKIEKDKVGMSALYAEMETKLKASDKFEASDVDWIIATVLGKNRLEAKLTRWVTVKQQREILRATERRAKGEPLSSIFGFVDFYGLRFDVNKKVLSPRQDTEVLVEEAIKKINELDLKNVLDLCTGSGAIAISVAKYCSCKVTATDISKQALSIAQLNAQKNDVKVDFIQSDLFKDLKKNKKYDIIISNPPYIKSGDIEKLDVEVKKYDPRLALDGGEDGLDFYRKIVEESKKRLVKKGWLFFEVGKGQADEVCQLLQEGGFDNVQTVKDYNKIERVVYGRIGK